MRNCRKKKQFLEKPKGSVRFEEAWKLKRAWNQMAQIFLKKIITQFIHNFKNSGLF